MMNLFKKRYRIITDTYSGYEVQYKYPLWPFWIQAPSNNHCTNTHSTLEKAKVFLAEYKNKKGVVYYE